MPRSLRTVASVGGLALAVLLAPSLRARDAVAKPRKGAPPCFSATAEANSAGTNAVFQRRHLQGGGPTWGALLEAFLAKATTFVREADPDTPGLPAFGDARIVRYGGAETWLVTDDEGDAAIVCAGNRALVDAVRQAHRALNHDARALEAALAAVPAGRLE